MENHCSNYYYCNDPFTGININLPIFVYITSWNIIIFIISLGIKNNTMIERDSIIT